VNAGQSYCHLHKPKRNTDKSRYGRRWEHLRELFLAKHPLCADCQTAGKFTSATEVHHIISVARGGSDREENLMPLCKSCHSKRTYREERDG
jgi:5-methylcytosine-specific restriction protein A